MSGLECLADLIINDDGVSACDTGYVCFLCEADIAAQRVRSRASWSLLSLVETIAMLGDGYS
jgi:hypothetical protein